MGSENGAHANVAGRTKIGKGDGDKPASIATEHLVRFHATAGTASLVLPPLFVVWEHWTRNHVPLTVYLVGTLAPLLNAVAAIMLIRRRVPAYDVPTIRGFALSAAMVVAFVGMSLIFHDGFGPRPAFAPIGRVLACLSAYAVVYAWSDAVGHLRHYLRGEFRSAEEARESSWFVRAKRPTSYKHILLDCVVLPPPPEGLLATKAPSHLTTVIPVVLVALFANTALINLRFLASGAEGAASVVAACPGAARWATYNALLAVAAASAASYLGTLVLHNRLSVYTGAAITIIVDFMPVLNIAWLLSRYADADTGRRELMTIIFGVGSSLKRQ